MGNPYLSVNAEGKRRLTVEAKQKWTHNYYEKRMKKLDKDFKGHDEDGGGPCHTHLLAKGRVRGFVVVCLVKYLVIRSPWYDTAWT